MEYQPQVLEKIPNKNILISDRLMELKPIKCANSLDNLIGNNCYTPPQNRDPSGYVTPYGANCPINYKMYNVSDSKNTKLIYDMNLDQTIPVNNNSYVCYKNCIENTKSTNITGVNYNFNKNGKQCIKKSFISQYYG
jgi:hypothetical protein